jgi:hypothetical protein
MLRNYVYPHLHHTEEVSDSVDNFARQLEMLAWECDLVGYELKQVGAKLVN